jgi:hypothetical protein
VYLMGGASTVTRHYAVRREAVEGRCGELAARRSGEIGLARAEHADETHAGH